MYTPILFLVDNGISPESYSAMYGVEPFGKDYRRTQGILGSKLNNNNKGEGYQNL